MLHDGVQVERTGLNVKAGGAHSDGGGKSGNHCRTTPPHPLFTAEEGVGGRSYSGGTNPARRRRLPHRRAQRPTRLRYLVSDADAGGRATIS